MPQPIWKPVEIAEDLVGQVHELLMSGAPDEALVAALERDGIAQATARRVVTEVRETTGQPPLVAANHDAVYGVEVTMARRWLRTLGPKDEPTAFHNALIQHGLTPSTAHDFAAELLEDCRRQDGRQGVRLRRLAVQGMIGGGLFTLFFASVALNGFLGPGEQSMARSEARWNAITALMTLALTAYSALLWHRHRHARQ